MWYVDITHINLVCTVQCLQTLAHGAKLITNLQNQTTLALQLSNTIHTHTSHIMYHWTNLVLKVKEIWFCIAISGWVAIIVLLWVGMEPKMYLLSGKVVHFMGEIVITGYKLIHWELSTCTQTDTVCIKYICHVSFPGEYLFSICLFEHNLGLKSCTI